MPLIDPSDHNDHQPPYRQRDPGCYTIGLVLMLAAIVFWLVIGWLLYKLNGYIDQRGKALTTVLVVAVLGVICTRTWRLWRSSYRADIISGFIALGSFIAMVMIVAYTVAHW